MAKKRKGKRRGKPGHSGGDVILLLMSQALVAGLVTAAVRLAEQPPPPRRSLAGAALRHPAATADFAHTVVHNKIVGWRERLQALFARRSADQLPPPPPPYLPGP